MNDNQFQPAVGPVIKGPFQALSLLFLSAPDSELHDFCVQADSLVVREPKILDLIDADLDRLAKEKKRMRMLDLQWEQEQTRNLPTMEFKPQPIVAEELKLGQGRPRHSAYMVYIFLMIRGYTGGFKSNAAQVLLEESVTMTIFLGNQEITMPGASTRSELVNAVSNTTRQFILDAQVRQILNEGWDDFKSLTIDSTAVSANTGWPTDSQMLVDLAHRFWHRGGKLDHFGVANLVDASVAKVLSELKSLNLKIQFSAGKPNSQGKRKRNYARLLGRVEKLAGIFQTHWEIVHQTLGSVSLLPSRYEQLKRLVTWMGEDIAHLRQVVGYCRQRVMEGITVGSNQKILSLSDPTAGYIAKGQRDPVIGYKPQLGRSRCGFIPCVVIPLGNAADVSQLPVVVDQFVARVGHLPLEISTDDGYACKAIREGYLAKGVKVMSVSGSKGKKMTSVEDWESPEYATARRERSAVESLMFTIKYGFDFGQVMRRGVEPVRAELLEKVIAYNCCRMVEKKRELRNQIKPADQKPQAA